MIFSSLESYLAICFLDRDDRKERDRDKDKDRDRKDIKDVGRRRKDDEDREIEAANALRKKLGLDPLQK